MRGITVSYSTMYLFTSLLYPMIVATHQERSQYPSGTPLT